MRIINVQANAQHFSYANAGVGGKTLNPGQSSPDVPLYHIHGETFQKDLDSGKIQIRLSDADKRVINRLLDEDKKPVQVKQLPPPPPRRQKKAKKAPAAPPRVAQPAPTSVAPVFENRPVVPVTEENLKAGVVSLADLQRANKGSSIPVLDAGQKSGLRDIQQFMKSKV